MGLGAARPALGFASRQPAKRGTSSTPADQPNSHILGTFIPSMVADALLACSLSRVAVTLMRIHNLHAGRPQETEMEFTPLRRGSEVLSTVTRLTASPTAVGQSILAAAGRRRQAAVCTLRARKGCRFAHFAGKASPDGSVQKRQPLSRAGDRGGISGKYIILLLLHYGTASARPMRRLNHHRRR